MQGGKTGEWLEEWAKYFLTTENTDCASAQRFLKGFSVFSVYSVVKVLGKPVQLSTLQNGLICNQKGVYINML